VIKLRNQHIKTLVLFKPLSKAIQITEIQMDEEYLVFLGMYKTDFRPIGKMTIKYW